MARRGENIYKRKDGRWEARYVKEIKADGKKVYGSVYGKNYNEVKAKQQLCIVQPQKSNCNSLNLTVSVLMSEWLFNIKNQVKPNTYQKYESIVRNHIYNEIGNLLVRLIKANNISTFTDSLVKKKLSVKTVNDILIVLNLAFKYA